MNGEPALVFIGQGILPMKNKIESTIEKLYI